MNDTLQTLIRAALKIGAGVLLSKGITNDSQNQEIIASIMGLIGIFWGICHRTSGSTNAKFDSRLVMLFLLPSLALFVGCASNPSKAHVIRASGVGTKGGIIQDPVTGQYSLGFQRVQAEIETIPIFAYTNAQGQVCFAMPDTVSRYEVNSHSAVFGNVAVTSTLATGSNAVVTQVGGSTPPINVNTGTGNQLTPLSH